MKLPSGQRLLMIHSGVMTLVFAGTVLMGATAGTRRATFDEITVHRINVIEPDGTLRMVISNAADSPGTPIKGHDYGRADRKVAGVIFMNDEGTEKGGLIFGGSKDKNGKVSSFGHLSFDSYDQDQTLVLQASQDNTTQKSSYVRINDPNLGHRRFAEARRTRSQASKGAAGSRLSGFLQGTSACQDAHLPGHRR